VTETGITGTAAALDRLRVARGFVFDMDGTLALGDRVNHGLRPLPGAIDMLAWVRDRDLPYLVFTNGTNRSPRHFAAVLREAGLDVPDTRMMTPATSAVEMFTSRGYQRIMVLGGDGLTGPLCEAGIEVVAPEGTPDQVDAVFVGWFREFTMDHLEAACRAVWAGAGLYSASETPFFAAAGGRALGTSRAISAMIRSITGCPLTITGKPSLDALRAAAARLGVRPMSRLVVVGDDPLLEVPMAHRGRALAVAVGTGLGGPDAYDDLPPRRQPHLNLRGIDELLSLCQRNSFPAEPGDREDRTHGRRLRSVLPRRIRATTKEFVMTEMRAVGCMEFGDPSVLRMVTVNRPAPGPGRVLVRVAAATVNPTDLGFRAGARALPDSVVAPYIPGMDLAGVIETVGPDVAGSHDPGWRVGDRVMAAVSPSVPGGGAQAEYVVVAEDQLARVPDGWSLEEAATLPMNGLTVAAGLDLLALPAGSTLAVTGSAGIVGQYAIQLGRHAGLTVIGDAAAADAALIESFGAQHVVERGDGMAAAIRDLYPDGVDAVIDAALLGPAILPAVRDGGQLLAVRPFQGETERDIAIHLVLVGHHLHEGHRITALADLVDKGVLTLRVAEVLPAERAAEAHRRLDAGGIRGRLVLTF
jgi:HAD superfamily hydrolase (TIGR01450 family)